MSQHTSRHARTRQMAARFAIAALLAVGTAVTPVAVQAAKIGVTPQAVVTGPATAVARSAIGPPEPTTGRLKNGRKPEGGVTTTCT